MPYTFFEGVANHPFQPQDTSLNLHNAWWLMDAALLAYSSDQTIRSTFGNVGISDEVKYFAGAPSTEAYVVSMPDAILLAFRGTQVDSFWPSVIDFAVDAQLLPAPDSHGDLVHAGFLAALNEVWDNISAQVRAEQVRQSRPFWITGHSLGAALATLAANRCGDDPMFGLKGVYTYGSPRVGDATFGARIRVPVFRFCNDSDLVPHLPLGLLFRHVGSLQFIDGAGHLHRDVPAPIESMLEPAAHMLAIRDAVALKGFMRTTAGAGLPLPGFLADHAPVNYSILTWNLSDTSSQ
jgi:hypothetical protein